MKKHISIMLVAAVVLLWSNALAKERRGAAVVIAKKDGVELRGELIAVKKDSLLLSDPSGKDASVEVAEIRQVEMKMRAGRYIGRGIIFGLVTGALAGYLLTKNGDTEEFPGGGAVYLGAIGVPVGAAAGLALGAAGKYKTIRLEGLSQEQLNTALLTLRKNARVRDYR